MTPKLTHRFILLLAALLLGCAAAPSLAQLSNMDKMTLIDGLRKEGMGELLRHLVKTEANEFKDPALARQVAINVDLLEYTDKGRLAGKKQDPEKAAQLRKDAIVAFKRAMAGRRSLIKDLYDNELRPMWQTDLVEQLFFEELPSINDHAAEFYEMGVPTKEQKEAFERIVPEALSELLDANLRFFQLVGDIPKRADFVNKWENTGLWARFKNEYSELRTPYFLGIFAYYATLLPNDNTYFTTLGADKRFVTIQKKTPAEERTRLLAKAIEVLEPFVQDLSDSHEIRRPSMSLTGRVLLAQGKTTDATAMLEQMLTLKQSDLFDLVAEIARAKAMVKSNRVDDALTLLAGLQTAAPANTNLLLRLLVVDQTHLILKARAEAMPQDKRAAGLDAAYDVYIKLLNDPALADNAQPLKIYVYKRWESSLPPGAEDNLKDVPNAVVAAIGEMARQTGKDLLDQAGGTEDKQAAADLRKQGKDKLDRAVKVNTTLLKRPGLAPAVHAQAMFNIGLAIYYLSPTNVSENVRAAMIFVDMADQFPDQPLSETSIGEAVGSLRRIFDLPEGQRPEGINQQYEKAVKVLLAKFPTTKAADASRMPYASDILMDTGRYAEAVEVLKQIPPTAPDYWPSQQLLVFSLDKIYQSAAPDARPKAAEAARAEGERILRESQAAMGGATSQEIRKAILQATGWSKLILAGLAGDEGQREKALEILLNFEQDYADEKALMQLMLSKRIILLLKTDKVDDAVANARVMMNTFPDSAAAVISEVITSLDGQIDDLRKKIGAEDVPQRKEEFEAMLKHKAEAAVQLAQMLRNWAPGHNLKDEQLLAIDLIYIKALRMSGRAKESMALIEPLAKKYPEDAQVILNEAEARFALGDKDNLFKASVLFDKIITKVPAEKGGKKPQIWWNAWTRRLQIMDTLKLGTKDIPIRIRELRARDPNLGGEQFKATLDSLEQKWATKV